MTCKKEESFTEANIPDLAGYVIIVTGATGGLGSETAKQLALRHARVYMTGRSRSKIEEVMSRLRAETYPQQLDLKPLAMDLENLASVKQAAVEFRNIEPRLDILINNAGIMMTPYEMTRDGHDRQWQVNYLAPHTFTAFLMPALLASAEMTGTKDRVRIVNVASDAAWKGPSTVNFEDHNLSTEKGQMAAWTRYCHSKMAMAREMRALHTRFQNQGVTAYAVHPGLIRTELQNNVGGVMGAIGRNLMGALVSKTPLEGSYNSLYAATSPDVFRLAAGQYMTPVGKVDPKPRALLDDEQENDRLWEMGNAQMLRILA